MHFSKFFSSVQETPWYYEFLAPVIHQVSHNSKVLDMGTGTGKLLQCLVNEKSVYGTGVDINSPMLAEAKKKLRGLNAELIQIKPGALLPFQDNNFDFICICNVLFNLSPENRDFLLSQSLRVLDENGKIIILSPTGRGKFKDFIKKNYKRNNTTFGLWYLLTRKNARSWFNDNYVKDFSKSRSLSSNRKMVFDGFGLLEIIKQK